jgi:hypothetical protein
VAGPTRLRADARGRDGGVRQKLAATVNGRRCPLPEITHKWARDGHGQRGLPRCAAERQLAVTSRSCLIVGYCPIPSILS